jgi:hypothetical protein
MENELRGLDRTGKKEREYQNLSERSGFARIEAE